MTIINNISRESMNFKKDFGIYLKENGAQKGTNIQIIDNFIPEMLVFFPDGKASITANINNMLTSFDLEYNVLNIFLSIFAQYGFLDKEELRKKMGKLNEGIPIGFKISDATRALEICGVVMSCELGEDDSNQETGEEFIPLNVVDIQIAEDPVARVIVV